MGGWMGPQGRNALAHGSVCVWAASGRQSKPVGKRDSPFFSFNHSCRLSSFLSSAPPQAEHIAQPSTAFPAASARSAHPEGTVEEADGDGYFDLIRWARAVDKGGRGLWW